MVKEVKVGPKKIKIPEEWDIKILDEITNNKGQYGANQSAGEYGLNKFRYLRITDISDDGRLKNDDKKSITKNDLNEKYILNEGDIVFARTGSVGRTYLYKSSDTDIPCAFAGYLIKFELNADKVDYEYLFHYTNSFLYNSWINSFARSTTLANINASEYRSLPVIDPPLPEQKKIADILSTVDENIAKTEEVIEKTKELKEGLMQDLFTRGILNNNLRLPPHEKQSIYKNTYLGFKPKDWINYQINEIAETDYGLNSAINKSLTAGIKMISVGNVNKDGTLDLNDINYAIEEKISPEDILIKSDILFNWRNGSKEHLGKTVFFDLNDKYTHVGLLIRIRTINNKSIYSKFLYYFLRYIHYKGYFTRAKKQVNNTFNKTELNDLQVFIPPLSEQKKITNILSAVDEKIQKEEEYKEKLELLKKGLMQKLLTGEVRVKVAN